MFKVLKKKSMLEIKIFKYLQIRKSHRNEHECKFLATFLMSKYQQARKRKYLYVLAQGILFKILCNIHQIEV